MLEFVLASAYSGLYSTSSSRCPLPRHSDDVEVQGHGHSPHLSIN
jgi:hypothetical protein